MEERLHFLDWLRVVLVCFVVYSHLVFCGAQIGRPRDEGTVDDHAYNSEHPNQLAVRWNSVARQWCIPLLFWVSGAANAASYSARTWKFCKALVKIAVVTVVGVVANASVWLLGPRDENCSFRAPCPNKGILFSFTEDPYSGNVEPYLNQMWYTLMLLFVTVLNRPLCWSLRGHAGATSLLMQWLVLVAIYVALVVAAGESCEKPRQLIAWLAVTECLFTGLAKVATPSKRASWLPLRMVHYCCAFVALSQVAASPIMHAPIVNDASFGYVLYLLLCVNKWFQLGVVMTCPRVPNASDHVDNDVKPFASLVWPLVLVLLVLCCPSTNWAMAGVLPYPYYARVVDRALYAGGTFLAMFVVDRCSRDMRCIRLPRTLSYASVVLYVFQVCFITIFLQLLERPIRRELERDPTHGGAIYVLALFLLSAAAAVLFTGLSMCVCSLARNRESRRWGTLIEATATSC